MYAADTRRAQAASKGCTQPVEGRWTGVEVYPGLNGGYTFRNLRTTNLLDESITHTTVTNDRGYPFYLLGARKYFSSWKDG